MSVCERVGERVFEGGGSLGMRVCHAEGGEHLPQKDQRPNGDHTHEAQCSHVSVLKHANVTLVSLYW